MNVLIVDDEQTIRQFISRVLTPLGHNVLETPGADEALLMLEQHPVAVALCDRSMPGRDGDWLIAQIRERFPSVAVVLATGDPSVPARISLQSGVVGYLVKPFRVDQVRDAVADAIAWHRAAAKAPRRQPSEG